MCLHQCLSSHVREFILTVMFVSYILLLLSPRIVLLNPLSLSIIISLLTFALIGQPLLLSEPWTTSRTRQNS